MRELAFFTFRDFSKHGGGSLRIKGILNALVKRGVTVTLISHTIEFSEFDENIHHIPLEIYFTKTEKKLFQFCAVGTIFQKNGLPRNWMK